jgi:serine/threonine-protein kinase
MIGHEKIKPDGSVPACTPAESRAANGDELQAGDRFEGYVIKECIGEGGMGTVYEAEEEFSGSVVAIKFLRGCFTGREDFVLRLQQESKFYSKLKHPNIVRMHRAGITAAGRVFIVMERLRAKTLRRILDRARNHKLDFLNALHLMLQVVEAVGAAHEAGVWHRDLKPENVMVGSQGKERGHVWVLDFGIATDRTVNTDELPCLGTYRYISPEQVRGKKPDGRADIYAFGVMAYEMLTGRHTFLTDQHDATSAEMASGHLHADAPTPVYELAHDCPELMWPILERCLAKNPDDRYATFDDVAADLRALIRSSVPPDHVLAKRVRAEKLADARRSAFDSLHESEITEDTAVAARTAGQRQTEPLVGYVVPDSVLPFRAGAARVARGKGFTEEIPRSAALMDLALAQTAPLVSAPPSHEVRRSSPVTPATPTAMSASAAPQGARTTPVGGSKWRGLPYVVAPLIAMVLTMAGTAVVLTVRASRPARASAIEPAATASPSASASATGSASASEIPLPPPPPEAAPSAQPMASVSASVSAAPPPPPPPKVQKPAQKNAPKAPKFVPLFSREEPFTKGKH